MDLVIRENLKLFQRSFDGTLVWKVTEKCGSVGLAKIKCEGCILIRASVSFPNNLIPHLSHASNPEVDSLAMMGVQRYCYHG